jgi:hypothetical protein
MNDVAHKSPSTMLAAGGAGFLALAGYFLVRDLALPPEIILTAAALLASVAAVLRWPRRFPAVGPGALLALALIAGAWYAVMTSPLLLPALALTAIGSIAAVALHGRASAAASAKAAGALTWYAAGTSFVVVTAALSFHFLTAGTGEESLAPRLIPTIAWLAAGLALLIAARRPLDLGTLKGSRTPRGDAPRAELAGSSRDSSTPGQVGMALAGIALVKALAYDSVRLQGALRVTMFAAVGALLLAGARLVGDQSADPEVDADAPAAGAGSAEPR